MAQNKNVLIEFDGPATAYCFGRTYDTLTSVGLKRQGQPYPGAPALDADSAWKAYENELRSYKAGATQLAWRSRPSLVEMNGGVYVYSRLAAFP